MILSASRRTDIPGYYSEWLMNRFREGFAYYRNPMNHAQLCKVLLTPENIECIVFWTKDPAPMLSRLKELDTLGYQYYFQFTITPYGLPYQGTDLGRYLEPNLRGKSEIIRTFQELSEQLGKTRVLWRYDPIVLNDTLTEEYHLEQFAALCKELSGYTELCTISFADIYRKLKNEVKEQVLREITQEQMHSLAAAFSDIAAPMGITLRACCEAIDLTEDGVLPASCIDRETVERICGHTVSVRKDKSQRPNCGCMKSIDIGAYNTCRNGCIYCYANHSRASIDRNCSRHDPDSPIMID
jgi:hypothetical protein